MNAAPTTTARKAKLIGCVLALLAGPCPAAEAAPPPLQLDSGKISGKASTRAPGVLLYLGIPYAAPPTGGNRWRPPQPPAPWPGVRAATRFGPSCPQPAAVLGGRQGQLDEDCLSLNVYAPAPSAGKLPVLVWLHGGGFTTGSAAKSLYAGDLLAAAGAVVVTVNYRLGPLGFFSHPALSAESPRKVSGNYGLLDQIAALRWVQRNISAFGGDPKLVTVFGESAGAVSVCMLLVSPLSKGLFHRAIAQSGGAQGRNRKLTKKWRGLESAEGVGEQIAAALGLAPGPDAAAALRAVTPDKLLAAASPAQGLFGKGIKFGPVIDGWVVPDDPPALLAAGRHHRVPVLTGSNADEGTVFLRQLPVRGPVGYRAALRRMFGDGAAELAALFPARSETEVRQALNRLTTVAAFVRPARSLARAAAQSGQPTWLYHFTYVPPIAKRVELGAFHGAEIFYLFGNVPGRVYRQAGGDKLAQRMRSYWLNFARTGDPNGPGLPAWPKYEAAADRYLEIGKEIKPGKNLYKDLCDRLDRIKAEPLSREQRRSILGRPPE